MAKKKATKKVAKKKAAPAKKARAKRGDKPTEKLGDPTKTYVTIKDLVAAMEPDMTSLMDNQVKAAGRRVRGYAQQIRKSAALLRKEVQAVVAVIKAK